MVSTSLPIIQTRAFSPPGMAKIIAGLANAQASCSRVCLLSGRIKLADDSEIHDEGGSTKNLTKMRWNECRPMRERIHRLAHTDHAADVPKRSRIGSESTRLAANYQGFGVRTPDQHAVGRVQVFAGIIGQDAARADFTAVGRTVAQPSTSRNGPGFSSANSPC